MNERPVVLISGAVTEPQLAQIRRPRRAPMCATSPAGPSWRRRSRRPRSSPGASRRRRCAGEEAEVGAELGGWARTS